VSVDSSGVQGNNTSTSFGVSIAANGRFVGFSSAASNLVAGDTNGSRDAFMRDRLMGTTERVSVDTGGAQGNGESFYPSSSADGRLVAFYSYASTLVSGDTNGVSDVFVRDRGASPGTDLCQASAGGVIACPCSNPPASAPRGCDNSSATGGAQLLSGGTASLAGDTVRFLTNGERSTALSVVLQGTALASSGIIYGQGVRCVGGTLRRLYTKAASGGSITAPGAGDPSVSARSTALGDPIGLGQHRYYLVYYRDPIVLGGCPATSTFNATQTLDVIWGP
jgi:hypothetical protein